MASTFLHEWFEQVWNRGDERALERLFAADGLAHDLSGPDGPALRGPEEFKPLWQQLRGAFPDLRMEVEDVVEEGNKVAGRFVARGTHTGEGLGIPATGRPIQVQGLTIAHLRDGQIVEAWNAFDFAAMRAQLADGALSPTEDR